MFDRATFQMQIKSERLGRPIADALPAMFECVGDVLAPLQITYRLEGKEELDRLGGSALGLWPGEEASDGDPITRIVTPRSAGLVAELREALAGAPARAVYASGTCAVRCYAHAGASPAWQARWRYGKTGFYELATLAYMRDEYEHHVQIEFPAEGYPLTPVRPSIDRIEQDGDSAIAAQNRALILPALGRVRGALGLAPGDVRWTEQSDISHRFPELFEEIEKTWMPKIEAG
jgi:hypothetical protein